jgi:hypothetical protein
MNLQKWMLFSLFSIPIFFLTGCVQGNLHVTINKDGSGIYQWKVLANARAQTYIKHISTIYSYKGYDAKIIREKGQVGFIATKPVKNIAKEPLNKEINDVIPAKFFTNTSSKEVMVTPKTVQPIKELTINSGFWKTSLLYQTQVNMQKNINHLAGRYAAYLSGWLNKQKFQFHLTLPIAPTKQNAQVISKDGKTLTWNLKLAQNNPIILGIDVPTPVILVLAFASNQTEYVPGFWTLVVEWLLVVLAIVIFIVCVIRILVRKRKSA